MLKTCHVSGRCATHPPLLELPGCSPNSLRAKNLCISPRFTKLGILCVTNGDNVLGAQKWTNGAFLPILRAALQSLKLRQLRNSPNLIQGSDLKPDLRIGLSRDLLWFICLEFKTSPLSILLPTLSLSPIKKCPLSQPNFLFSGFSLRVHSTTMHCNGVCTGGWCDLWRHFGWDYHWYYPSIQFRRQTPLHHICHYCVLIHPHYTAFHHIIRLIIYSILTPALEGQTLKWFIREICFLQTWLLDKTALLPSIQEQTAR